MATSLDRIERACTEDEVIGVVLDYLATWQPDELVLLPSACRPGRVKDAEDLEILHSILAEEFRRNTLAGDQLAALRRMTAFVVRASIRIAELAAARARDEDAPPVERRSDPQARGPRTERREG
jgi:hypothetical protein